MQRRLCFGLVFCFLGASIGRADRAPDDSQRRENVDSVLAEVDRTDSPGCALGVFWNGRIEYARGYGMANLELSEANSPQTAYDIGSTSKQFTVTAVLLLEQDGILSIDDDVRKYVPELPTYGPTITVRNLMQHTSGLRDYLELFWLAGIKTQDLTTDQDALDIIVRQKALNFAPGDDYLYSNSGFFLLSQIVKRVSGKSLAELAEERIFGPLDMRHTRFLDNPRAIVPGRATGYDRGPAGGFTIDMSDYEQTGDGAVYTTVEDLFLWDQNFYEPRVGTREILARMQTPGRLNRDKPMKYGLGLVTDEYRGLKTVSHGGAWAGYRAQLLRFPDQHFSVACTCNLGSTNPSELAKKVAEVYLGDKMKPEEASARSPSPVSLSAAELDSRAGTYRDMESGSHIFLSEKEGKLVVEGLGAAVELPPVSETRFLTENPYRVEVVFDGASSDRLSFRLEDETTPYERIEPWKPSVSELSQFAGVYGSVEVPRAFEIRFEDGALTLRHRNVPPEAFRPTSPDAFHVAGLELRFSRDKKKRINGFHLDMGRVKGIRFETAP